MTRYAVEIMTDQLAAQQQRIKELEQKEADRQAKEPSPAPSLAQLARNQEINGEKITHAQLAALRSAQAERTLQYADGQLVKCHTEDETGRRVRHFFGDPEACWGAFKQPTRRLLGFNKRN